MATQSSYRKITWDEIVPRLPELSGRKLHIAWGNRGESRRATCRGVRYNDAGQIFIHITDVMEVFRGEPLSDVSFGIVRYFEINSLGILENQDTGTIYFDQPGETVTFFAPKRGEQGSSDHTTTIQAAKPQKGHNPVDKDRMDRANKRLRKAQQERDKVVVPQTEVIRGAYAQIRDAQQLIDKAEAKFSSILTEVTREIDEALGIQS